MTLARRYSRVIMISHMPIRWSYCDMEEGGYLLVAHHRDIGGQQVEIGVDRHQQIGPSSWHYETLCKGQNPFVFQPRKVEILLKKALSLGWRPEVKAKPFGFHYRG